MADSARNGEGCVWIYPDIAKSKERRALIEKLDRPYGLAFQQGEFSADDAMCDVTPTD